MPFSHHLKTVRQYYETTAPDYREFWTGEQDLAMHFGYGEASDQTHSASLLKLNEVAARLAGVTCKDRVLDAGCGYGGSAIWLALNKGCRVEGVNIVPEQLRTARRFAAKRNLLTKVHFSLQDYCATRFRSASFDVVWALESVIHSENKKGFALEAVRLLRHDGRLLVADLVRDGTRAFLPAERKCIRQVERGWALSHLLSSSDCRDLFAQSGFTDVRLLDRTAHVINSVKRLAGLCNDALPEAKAKLARGEWTFTRFENLLACIGIHKLMEAGAFKYVIVTGRKR